MSDFRGPDQIQVTAALNERVMKKYWIFISTDDPRNARFARWAEICVVIEWMLILASAAVTPTDYVMPFRYQVTVLSVSLALLLAGFRGLLSKRVPRLGSIALLATNLLIFLGNAYSIASNYLAFQYG